MLFHSIQFWLFFFGVWVLYRGLSHRNQNLLLLVASYAFYAAWDWRFLSLIWLSTAVDYTIARRLGATADPRRRKRLLGVSVATNLGLLGVFKYAGFFLQELAALLGTLGFATAMPVLEIALPVGISFYTFQTMSYTIDVYRGDFDALESPLDLALYVAFFPQLVAGPIERPSRLVPQIQAPRQVGSQDLLAGLDLVLSGLFRKVVVADNLAPVVDYLFGLPPEQLGFCGGLLASYAFAFQIYGDFSGYSRIARGTARWLGFDLMANFRAPYLARSPSEFWRRWHISLSSWLRDYLYIPLGGSRTGSTRRNLMATMLLGGLWHGAGWTFVAWGALHGLLLIATHRTRGATNAASPHPLTQLLQRLVLFHLVCASWVFFRATSLAQALAILGGLAAGGAEAIPWAFLASSVALYAVPLLLLDLLREATGDPGEPLRCHWTLQGAAYAFWIVSLILFGEGGGGEFLYFQF